MALNTFGWTPAEVTQDSAGNVVAGVTLTVFTDITKATRVTGLFDKDGVTPLANNVVVSDTKGRFGFKAPDTYSLLYVYDGSTADPWPIAAHEALDAGIASHAQAVADAQAARDAAIAQKITAASVATDGTLTLTPQSGAPIVATGTAKGPKGDPGAASTVPGPKGEPGGSDQGFADWINTSNSQTRGALNATFEAPAAVVIAGDAADLAAKVNATTSGVVHVPRGVYSLTTPLQPKAGVTVRGEGNLTVIRLGNGANMSMFNIAASDVTIRSLKLDGNRTQQTVNSNGVMTSGARTRVLDVHVTSCNGYNIVAFPGASDFIVRNCVSEDARDECIEFQGCDGGSAVGNTVVNPGKNGIYVYRNTASNAANICRNVTISGNTVRNPASLTAGYSGIHVDDGATGVTVTGNVVTGGAGASSNGIRIESTSAYLVKDVTLSGNVVSGATKSGVLVKNASGVTVTGNTVSGCQRSGIEVQNSTDFIVTDNVCRNNGQDAADTQFGNGITVFNNTGTVDRGVVRGNRCYDDQGTKTQDYGIRTHNTIGASVVIGPNILDGNLTSGQVFSSPGATGPSCPPWKLLSNITVTSTGNTIPHGLPYVPQTVMVFMRSAGTVWRGGGSDATSIVLISDSGSRTCDVLVG